MGVISVTRCCRTWFVMLGRVWAILGLGKVSKADVSTHAQGKKKKKKEEKERFFHFSSSSGCLHPAEGWAQGETLVGCRAGGGDGGPPAHPNGATHLIWLLHCLSLAQEHQGAETQTHIHPWARGHLERSFGGSLLAHHHANGSVLMSPAPKYRCPLEKVP